jgi:transposase
MGSTIAVTYCKNQWGDLIRYIDHGGAHISNCLIENQVRPFAIGKKNWMFIGNETAGQRAALLYSLIQSCELNQIDPRKYLEYVINHIHKLRKNEIDPATLLPNTINKALLETKAANKV